MKKRNVTLSILIIVMLLTALPGQMAAKTKELQLRWEDLAPLIVGKQIELLLPDGTFLYGKARGVGDEKLLIDVEASNATNHPKGQVEVARSLVDKLVLTRKTIRWRLIGIAAGVIGGAAIGVAALYGGGEIHPEALLVIPLTAMIGYFAARSADSHEILIRIEHGNVTAEQGGKP
jgi:hypothetical protein